MFSEPENESRGGFFWVRENYDKVRTLLNADVPNAYPALASESQLLTDDWLRDESRWTWILESFVQLAHTCETSVRLYGPALVEYPALLDAINVFQEHVTAEERYWERWRGQIDQRQEWLRSQSFEARAQLERPDSNLPKEAMKNMHNLATLALRVIAAATHALSTLDVSEEWGKLPAEQDTLLSVTTWVWPEKRWD